MRLRNAVQLAIETSGRGGTLAILRGESVLEDIVLGGASRTAAALTPAVDRALRWCRDRQLEPELISVAAGPGSFTGLRIGVTTAKTLSYATRCPLVAVDSLAAIAAAALADTAGDPGAAVQILVGVTAYRRQVFSGRFARPHLLPPIDAIERRRWLDPLAPPGVEVETETQWKATVQQLSADIALAGDRKLFGDAAARLVRRRSSDAVGVGLLGLRAALTGQWADPMGLTPRYLKPSAAEEKAAQGSP